MWRPIYDVRAIGRILTTKGPLSISLNSTTPTTYSLLFIPPFHRWPWRLQGIPQPLRGHC